MKILETPCGQITVTDPAGNKVAFEIQNNSYRCDYCYENEAGDLVAVNTDTNYDLRIPISGLKDNTQYQIRLSGTKLEFNDSDERTESVAGRFNGYAIAIGDYDPNDDEKDQQMRDWGPNHPIPFVFDESKFRKYDVERLEDDSGFRFHLVDRDFDSICFKVAWIQCEKGWESDFESAAAFWTI